MPRMIEKRDVTVVDQDGWAMVYGVERNDGHVVEVRARCSDDTAAVVGMQGSADDKRALADRCHEAALVFAEKAQSPASRGSPVIVFLSFDPFSGSLTSGYQYPSGAAMDVHEARMDLASWFAKMLEEIDEDSVDDSAIADLKDRVATAFVEWRVATGYGLAGSEPADDAGHH